MSFVVVIPARYQSTRLPGKPLADIHGQPMIAWVVERAKQAALQAYKAAKAMGDISDEQFIQLFTTLSNAQEFTGKHDSANHNTRRAKAGKGSNIIAGDGNTQIVKGDK